MGGDGCSCYDEIPLYVLVARSTKSLAVSRALLTMLVTPEPMLLQLPPSPRRRRFSPDTAVAVAATAMKSRMACGEKKDVEGVQEGQSKRDWKKNENWAARGEKRVDTAVLTKVRSHTQQSLNMGDFLRHSNP